ncbi:MAG TPA: ammonia-forming cytochrome c nitrite reductase subunit c552 [Enhygromyxa sp.]|nr:ammonia-forming cytochrome c nitrite reductase subunit c552 [Enhygromyxa sp.]
MTNEQPRRWLIPIGVGVASAFAVFALLALIMNIAEHKRDAREPFVRVVELDESVDDPAVWGQNFPDQYDAFVRTVDMQRTRFGGSEALPRPPSRVDPRLLVSRSLLDEDPRLARMWAGYAFSIDYREKRGHAYMLEDQTFTARHQKPQPGTCMSCHASTVSVWRALGDGDLAAGAAKMSAMPYAEARTHVNQAIACIDCHDPETLDLRITRPAFIDGIRALKAAQGIDDYDVNRMATRAELRTYVCAQCHVEYYFAGAEKTLTHPWQKGVRADQMFARYQDIGFSDWTHESTQAPMLKPQHPEFELWSQGTHAQAGVTCVDCHMPYQRVGAKKVTDHHIRSPLLDINRACQTCHNVPESQLLARAEGIQAKTIEMADGGLAALMGLIDAIEAARAAGTSAEQLESALQAQRRATWYLDFVLAENSSGFHAPQESARVLFLAMDAIRAGHVALGER